MKISVWIPKGKENVRSQLKTELKTASQINDEYKRADVTNALEKIIARISDAPSDGVVICSDGCEVVFHPYSGKAALFRADKEYIFPGA
jgi:peptide subunit release factor 1 (eRF1)